MSEKRCKTCKWWRGQEHGRGSGISDNGRTAKRCLCPKVVFASLEEIPDVYDRRQVVDDQTGLPLADDCAAVFDSEGYFAGLFPGPEFGCVHWEQSDER